ncbi:protein of unknown function DUF676, lipase-like [Dillenia turbinata]|uniref:DUF676 domain-containing protein n=1 Tax=Dillenia turbinata TaxID=194707 RepID=A0AAN8ZU29_9MAGN
MFTRGSQNKNIIPATKRLQNAKKVFLLRPVKRAMFDTFHEIAIYIHRFHNLDLFQQGWYQIKITMRWEDGHFHSPATPARVVQYEAPDLGPDDVLGVWRIDDKDNSFSTQPFRIKYAKQDVLLSVMISFNLPLGEHEAPSASAVILKFELMYTPVLENGPELQASLDGCPTAVHEFRIPPKALLGLHSYCPVYFDAFHSVLVDTTVHITLLKASVSSIRPKASGVKVSQESKQVNVVKGLVASRDMLLEELQKLSKATDLAIDLTEFTSKPDESNFSGFPLQEDYSKVDAEVSRQSSGNLLNGFKEAIGSVGSQGGRSLQSFSLDELARYFSLIGYQVLYLWNTFLKFHRANKTKILEVLHDTWASDRRAEWSIWMVHSKVDMPHHYLITGGDDSAYHGHRGKAQIMRKMTDDPAQTAAARAELHRRSIAQMRINNRSIQDMQIFGDPLHVPVIIVERVVNALQQSHSGNSFFSPLDAKENGSLFAGPDFRALSKLSGASSRQSGRVLKIVVFVHGFQGHHLDLRMVRNQWVLIDPKVECLMSEVNEDKTTGDFREMGLRLAQEVTSFVKKKMDKASRSGGIKSVKLSFVGHSIGNVIIRTALAESIMAPFLKYLYTYLSVSGPHLGYLYSSNSLFNSGLWLLKKLKGTQCIHQLTFTDDPDLQNTFFYKLCKMKTLEHFKNIILLSSPQDGYVPYHSARIETCPASSRDFSKKGRVFLQMLNNCLDQIRAPTSEHRVFMRCDVNFDISVQGKNLNTMIGRAAHIEFLESDIFAKFIMWSFPDLFR